ncbi:endonuclease/exonuclease/phosphatase family protein [Pseudoxanthomonas composti]|uniref:Endonuclease/exonuclease/phosphatase family protein n=1 Tax=Pseudoxanthomonas composti TaxID=2137479 RepID=A0A4Q1JSZ5_9GAMM|nr:endonuclease/exonuclease/phosphatase family protein [Pseudoxanthomonas composti]RXR03431.1 endonuclease/exonuclease/phosphatase family protein [Pseudoxanthomonas composti]
MPQRSTFLPALHRALRVVALLMLSTIAGNALAATPAKAQTLKVMSFNVRTPADTNDDRWENRRQVLFDMLREQDPDVIGTQELVKRQANDIIAALPQYTWFGTGRRGDDSDEHMGVFYRPDRLRVLDSGNFWLSDTPEVPGSISWNNLMPRMVTWARFERIADGARFTLYNTHLPYREQDEDARERGAKLILQRMASLPANEPFVLTGDFNAKPDSGVHKVLTETLSDAWLSTAQRSGPERTFHNFTGKPDYRIDWVLYRNLQLQSVQTIDMHRGARYPSDHFPVLARFLLPSPAR